MLSRFILLARPMQGKGQEELAGQDQGKLSNSQAVIWEHHDSLVVYCINVLTSVMHDLCHSS